VTCGLALLLAGIVALNAVLWIAAPVPYNETVLHHTWDLLHGRSVDDSWGVMMSAVDYLRAPGPDPVYSELFFKRGQRFQYPPSSLFTLEGMLRLVGFENVRTNKHVIYQTVTLNDVLGWAFVALTAAATAALLERSLRLARIVDDTRALQVARWGIVLGLTLTFYPIVKAYTLGQIQVWINGLFALALLLWAGGRTAASGFLLGAVALVKPHFGLFLLWAALRRAWPFAIAFAVTVAIGLALSVAVYGLANHLDYVRVLRVLSQNGELYFPNQSVNGLLNRWMLLGESVVYDSLNFSSRPPFNVIVYSGTLVSSLVLLAIGLLWRSVDGSSSQRVLDFCVMALCLTLASPVAWEHHFGITLPIFAVLPATAGRRHLPWLVVSYLLIATFLPITNLLARTPWNVLQSLLFAGALILLALLIAARRDAPSMPVAGRRAAGLPLGSLRDSDRLGGRVHRT
jgi:alpha-1,2-mannosyltransferase